MIKNRIAKTGGNPIERHIGRRLRQRRLECGLTLETVDDRIGGRKGTTRIFEEGRRFVGPADLFALSEALEVDVSFFFLGAGKSLCKANPLALAPDVVEGARRLVQAYYNIRDRNLRRSVVDLLKDIAKDETLNDS